MVQIGITSIGVLNGIVGEAAFAEPLSQWMMARFDAPENWTSVLSTGLVVVIITFLTIIFGELVPKRLGQLYPEAVARLVAQPMEWLSIIARPFVKLLSFCTEGTLRILGIRGGSSRAVTEEASAAQRRQRTEGAPRATREIGCRLRQWFAGSRAARLLWPSG